MRIADICTRNVIHVLAGTTVREAAETMRKRHVGTLVVLDGPDGTHTPVGIVSDRDIVLAVVAPGVDPETVTVADIMTRRVATSTEDQDLFGAILTMRERGVRRLPVLNARGDLAGMVSADDIYGALAAHMQELGCALTREQVRELEVRT